MAFIRGMIMNGQLASVCKEAVMACFKADYPRMRAIAPEGALKCFPKHNKLLMIYI
jgi:hypothetical protein